MFALSALIQDDVLTFREVLSGIPHDAAAIFVYLLLATFIGFIWWGSRKRTPRSMEEKKSDDVTGSGQPGLQ